MTNRSASTARRTRHGRSSSGCERHADVYTFGYTYWVRAETLSVREAREQLPSLLERFRRGERAPVYLGSHRRTEAVMLPVEVYDELMAQRQNAADQSLASLRVEGYTHNPAVEVVIERWVHGEITDAEMEREVHALYGVAE